MSAICADCGEPSKYIWVDLGIGYTEFWGVPGIDKDERWVSECCWVESDGEVDG